MSTYYNYYIGYRDKDTGLLYPLGPFDCFGNLKAVISRSRSFASDLHDDFYPIDDDNVSKELKENLGYKESDGTYSFEGKYLDAKDLPSGNYIKSGYFLISDIEEYIKTDCDSEGLFYDKLTPTMYALKMHNELAFGPPKEKLDCEGNVIEQYSCADYAYFSYPDYLSKEYESDVIRQHIGVLEDYDFPKDFEIVVLETET